MTRVTFTSQLRRFTQAPDLDVTAATLRDALAAAFDVNPRLRGYVLDDQAHLRANVVVFIDGLRVRDRVTLDDRLAEIVNGATLRQAATYDGMRQSNMGPTLGGAALEGYCRIYDHRFDEYGAHSTGTLYA